MVSELSIIFIITPSPPDGHCVGGTHPTGMHSCFNYYSTGASAGGHLSAVATITRKPEGFMQSCCWTCVRNWDDVQVMGMMCG